jgi:hypothetical protein
MQIYTADFQQRLVLSFNMQHPSERQDNTDRALHAHRSLSPLLRAAAVQNSLEQHGVRFEQAAHSNTYYTKAQINWRETEQCDAEERTNRKTLSCSI